MLEKSKWCLPYIMHYLIRVHFPVSLKRKASASICALHDGVWGGEETSLHAKLIQHLMLPTGPKIYDRELPEQKPFWVTPLPSTLVKTPVRLTGILNLWLFLRVTWRGSQCCLVVLPHTDLQYFLQQRLLTSAHDFVLSSLNIPTCDLSNQHPRCPTGASV